MIYEFLKCTDDLVLPGEPPCAKDMDAINEWLHMKSAHLRVLNKKVDFSLYSDVEVRQNEIWLPAVQLKKGIYTDQGYRFRENEFENISK